jgi:hypothetical protein
MQAQSMWVMRDRTSKGKRESEEKRKRRVVHMRSYEEEEQYHHSLSRFSLFTILVVMVALHRYDKSF